MAVGKEEVRRVAALARLRLEDAEVERITGELNGILEHIRTLAEVDVSGVAGPVRLPDDPVRFRDPDLPPDPLAEGAPADMAPEWRDGFFLVPRLPAVEGGAGADGGSAGEATGAGEP